MIRTSQELQCDVAILIKQSDDLKVFARELANAVNTLRGGAEALQAAIGKPNAGRCNDTSYKEEA